MTLPSLSLQESNSKSLTLHSLSVTEGSLILPSLSITRDRFNSLTLRSLSLTEANLQSLTLQSLSLSDENGFQRISFKEVSFEDGSLKENEDSLAHSKLERRAGTNSFSSMSFEKRMLAQEAETNSFSQSLSKRNLSLRMCLRIFLLCSFQLVCAALLLENCSFRISFPTESLQADQLVAAYRSSFRNSSLQPEELAAAYCRKSLEQQSLQQEELVPAYSRRSFQQESLMQDDLAAACFQSPTRASELTSFEQNELHRSILDSFDQLDLEISLSFPKLGSTSFSYQLQAASFNKISFEHRAFLCAALLDTTRFNMTASGQISSELSAYRGTAWQLGSRGSFQQHSFADKSF